jgi:hypothetical protein
MRSLAALIAALLAAAACSTPDKSIAPTPPPKQTTTMAPQAGPTGRLVPWMVDIPGPGVLMFSGIDESVTVVQDLWSFDPQGGWTSLPSGPDVAEDFQDAIVYDPATGLVWLTRPSPEGSIEVWTYEPAGGRWSEVGSTGGPPSARYLVALDAESHQLIHFTNCFDAECRPQTWAFDIEGNEWERMDPPTDPGVRQAPVMGYDVDSDRVILFGGAGLLEVGQLGDTWAYDFNGDTWTEMDPATSPPPSSHAFSMVYEPITDRLIFFGGQVGTQGQDEATDDPFTAIGGTWAYDYDADEWTRIRTEPSPRARELSGLAYDAETGLIVLFSGGHAATYPTWTTYADTWIFDPRTDSWTEWSPAG